MHILLTRPLEDCSEMIIKFQSLGHKVSHLPLLSIKKIFYEKIDFSKFGAIIFTSSNAVRFLNMNGLDKNIKCFCVGDATEKEARGYGFSNTIAAEGNVLNLKELSFILIMNKLQIFLLTHWLKIHLCMIVSGKNQSCQKKILLIKNILIV